MPKSWLSSPMIGAAWMVVAGLAFAIINSMIQYLGINFQVSSSTAALCQYTIALFVFIPLLNRQRLTAILQSDYRFLHVLRVALSVVGIQLWTWALAYPVPIWQGIALLMTSPLFATLGSGWLLKESISWIRWAATATGFVGAMLILAPWSDAFSWASLLPLAAAAFWASASLLTKYTVSKDTPVTIVVYLLVLMLPFDLLIASPTLSLPNEQLAWVLLIAAGILTALAQWAIAKAYSLADASFIQPFDHIKLPLNVLVGFWVFGWVPPGRLWLGSALIIFAVVLVTRHEHRQPLSSYRT